MTTTKRLAALLALLALAACSSTTDPAPLGDAYALATVDGRPLPYRWENETWHADTVWLDGDRWSRVQVVRLHAPGADGEPVRRTSAGTVTALDGRIVLDFDCDDVLLRSCVAPDTLVRYDGGDLARAPNRYGQSYAFLPLFLYAPVPSR